jgi:hypothetical protein
MAEFNHMSFTVLQFCPRSLRGEGHYPHRWSPPPGVDLRSLSALLAEEPDERACPGWPDDDHPYRVVTFYGGDPYRKGCLGWIEGTTGFVVPDGLERTCNVTPSPRAQGRAFDLARFRAGVSIIDDRDLWNRIEAVIKEVTR